MILKHSDYPHSDCSEIFSGHQKSLTLKMILRYGMKWDTFYPDKYSGHEQ